jgi:hypothetical protein
MRDYLDCYDPLFDRPDFDDCALVCPYAVVVGPDESVGIFGACVESCTKPDNEDCPHKEIERLEQLQRDNEAYMNKLAKELYSNEV